MVALRAAGIGAEKHGRKSLLVRVEREGSSHFVALPLETS
jgi:hypothetical protein